MDIVCFSHLRWDFVYQRPQHLMTRFAKQNRVFLIEEPHFNADVADYLEYGRKGNLTIVIPHLRHGVSSEDAVLQQVKLLKDLFEEQNIANYLFWYYTPMATAIGNHFTPDFILYDCMDELSNFNFAPPELKEREKELFTKADLVLTGGHNLYQAKKDSHHNIHPLPSSIDKDHFIKAREISEDPEDQKNIPHPRFGYYGVVDERFDIDLVKEVAEKKPEWHFVIIGPVVKIDPETLPRLDNIHYLGGKKYEELPPYLGGWDVAVIPFLRNDSTKFISPTKTPEYLAGGKPVISTSITDVVTPYGVNNLVHITDTAEDFIQIAEKELRMDGSERHLWLQRVDEFLSHNSWDKTWNAIMQLISETQKKKTKTRLINIFSPLKQEMYV